MKKEEEEAFSRVVSTKNLTDDELDELFIEDEDLDYNV